VIGGTSSCDFFSLISMTTSTEFFLPSLFCEYKIFRNEATILPHVHMITIILTINQDTRNTFKKKRKPGTVKKQRFFTVYSTFR
jgi:hypothetical protein